MLQLETIGKVVKGEMAGWYVFIEPFNKYEPSSPEYIYVAYFSPTVFAELTTDPDSVVMDLNTLEVYIYESFGPIQWLH